MVVYSKLVSCLTSMRVGFGFLCFLSTGANGLLRLSDPGWNTRLPE
jgi:hypothetical protein